VNLAQVIEPTSLSPLLDSISKKHSTLHKGATTMKVKDLIRELKLLDPEMPVILQKDSEGNGYSPLAGTDENCVYVADSNWSGEIYDTTWTAEEALMDEEEWAEIQKQPRCVVLFPVN
jgi:hypothetical protein